MSNEQMKNQLEDQHMDESQLNARRIKEAWQVMTLGQKIEYLWMYYKSRLAGALLIAGAIYLGITMYKGTHTEVLINITVVGGNSQQVEWLEESFAEYAGISPEDGIIKIQDGFMNIEELPEADNLDISKSMAKDALLLGSDNILKKEEMILYDDACAVIPVTSKNQDMAARFLEYLQQCS